MQIQIDITEVAGPKLADLRNIGIVPDAIDGGRDLHVSNPSGSRIVVRDYNTDEVIVSGNGWGNAMQALADHYGLPVQVSRDYGVTGGKSGKVLGLWAPTTTPAPKLPKLTHAQAATLRLAAEGYLHHTPSNVDRAPRHAWRGQVFTGHPKQCGFKSDIKTQSATVLDALEMLSYDYTKSCKVVPSQLGLDWLAAHPA